VIGSCTAGGAALATTTDGGKTWVDAKTPLRTIVRCPAQRRPVGVRCRRRLGLRGRAEEHD